MVTGGAVLLLNKEKKRRSPCLFPRHREDQEARKSPIFKSTEQNTRTGSKTKSSPLRTTKMEQSSPVRRLSLERSPEATTFLGGRFLWTLKELRLWHSNPAASLRVVHSLHLEKKNLEAKSARYDHADPWQIMKRKQKFTNKISRTTCRTCVERETSFRGEEVLIAWELNTLTLDLKGLIQFLFLPLSSLWLWVGSLYSSNLSFLSVKWEIKIIPNSYVFFKI